MLAPCRRRLRRLCWSSWRSFCMLPVVTATIKASERLTTLRLVVLLHLIDVTARTRSTAQQPHFYSEFIRGCLMSASASDVVEQTVTYHSPQRHRFSLSICFQSIAFLATATKNAYHVLWSGLPSAKSFELRLQISSVAIGREELV